MRTEEWEAIEGEVAREQTEFDFPASGEQRELLPPPTRSDVVHLFATAPWRDCPDCGGSGEDGEFVADICECGERLDHDDRANGYCRSCGEEVPDGICDTCDGCGELCGGVAPHTREKTLCMRYPDTDLPRHGVYADTA